jgi:FKBP-type peptidyl-prolyl cis-trans isomerase 2
LLISFSAVPHNPLLLQVPAPGDVFLYPVADGAYVPTRVAAIGEQYVELDANYGVTGAQLQLEVRLVALQKQ